MSSLCLAACSAADGAPGAGAGPTEPTGPVAATARCIEVPDEVLAQIAIGTEAGRTFTPDDASAVETEAGRYVVAVRFRGDGDESQVGVWTATGLTDPVVPVLVADEVASAYTTWSRADEFPTYGVPLDSPLIPAARDCLGG